MGRPRTRLLDRERIATTALALLDETGDLTMTGVAAELGVHVSSLYVHVRDRGEVVELVRERVADTIEAPAGGGDWEEAVVSWARAYRRAFSAHARAIALLATEPVRGDRAVAHYDRMVALLVTAGARPDQALAVLTALESFVLGSALDAAAPEQMWEVADAASAPALAAALAAAPAGRPRADHAFDLGLLALVRGVAALLEASGELVAPATPG